MREIGMEIEIKEIKEVNKEKIIELYKANKWSSAEKPDLLYKALMNSDSLITAWDGNRLVGLGNAISDGYWLFITRIFWYTLIIKEKESAK